MIVVADTSPLNYLVLIGAVDVLPALFGEVLAPPAVIHELQHPGTPPVVREWIRNPPNWLAIRVPNSVDSQLRLGLGEVEAISLALELQAELLLVDDRRARREAIGRGLLAAGTINVLEAAAKKDLIDLPQTIDKLRQTNFHVADALIQRVLKSDAQRRGKADS